MLLNNKANRRYTAGTTEVYQDVESGYKSGVRSNLQKLTMLVENRPVIDLTDSASRALKALQLVDFARNFSLNFS